MCNLANIERKKAISDIIVSWLGVLAVAAGGMFGFVQYLDYKKERRVSETLKFIERYSKAPYFQAQTKLNGVWINKTEEMEEILIQNNKTKKEIDGEFSEFIVNQINQNEIREHFLIMMFFYESLAVCAEKHLCDVDTTLAFFGKSIVGFYHQHFPFILHLREETNNARLAISIETFSKKYRKTLVGSVKN